MSIAALLQQARLQLSEQMPADEAAFETHLLMQETLQVSRAWLMAHAEQTLTSEREATFLAMVGRRLQGEPVAYILGHREFYGLDLLVTPDVLIPRPDTETLVEAALSRIPHHQPCRVLDLGTGSGAIAIAIARHRPEARVIAVDTSAAALKIARRNADNLQTHNLNLLQSDWFGALSGAMFEVIVSNPPYIACSDPHLKQGDLRFEPETALASGMDGLNDLRDIVAAAPAHLQAGGWLLLEHGYDQAPAVAGLLTEAGFADVGHAADLAGITRVTFGKKPARGKTV